MKLWLEKNVIEMYLTHNEGKSVVAERFIRTFKDKIYKFMPSISKNRYIDVKLTTHIDFDKKNNKENPEFKVGDHVRISNYKNIFAKVYVPNWSEEVFVIKKVKNTVPWAYVINDPNGQEIVGTFYG